MSNLGGRRLLWVLLLIILVASTTTWLLRDETADGEHAASRDVIASQRPAIDALRASAPITFKTDEEGRVTQLVARGPKLTDTLAVHLGHLPDLVELELGGSGVGAQGLQAIGQLEKLESLRLDKTQITDDDLQHLAGLGKLRELFLSDCAIGDAGLEPIGELTALQLLDLSRTQVSDEGVKRLGNLPDLEKLYLAETKVSGTAFAQFPESNRLLLLNLSETPVTGEGLETLRRFTKLQSLYLDSVAFDDARLAILMDVATESFPELNGLFLSQTPLGDTAIEPLMALADMPHLSLVGLNGTRISKAAFMQLASKTPETRYLVDYEAGNN